MVTWSWPTSRDAYAVPGIIAALVRPEGSHVMRFNR
jgi:hypothetical protein